MAKLSQRTTRYLALAEWLEQHGQDRLRYVANLLYPQTYHLPDLISDNLPSEIEYIREHAMSRGIGDGFIQHGCTVIAYPLYGFSIIIDHDRRLIVNTGGSGGINTDVSLFKKNYFDRWIGLGVREFYQAYLNENPAAQELVTSGLKTTQVKKESRTVRQFAVVYFRQRFNEKRFSRFLFNAFAKWLNWDVVRYMAAMGYSHTNSSLKEYGDCWHAQPLLSQIKREQPLLLGLLKGNFSSADALFGPHPLRAIKNCKNYFISLGLTQAGWRKLCSLPPQLTASMEWKSRAERQVSVYFLNALAEVGEKVPFTIAQKTYRSFVFHDGLLNTHQATHEHLTCMLRAAARHVKGKRLALKDFVGAEFHLVLDWLFRDRALRNRGFDAQQRTAPWSWWMRQQDQWHDLMAQQREARFSEEWPEGTRWESVSVPDSIGEVSVAALETPAALQQEGREMRHCVASYVADCLSGHSRIYSLRSLSHRATVELRIIDSEVEGAVNRFQVQVRQVRGVKNRLVPALETAANTLAKLYKQALNKAPEGESIDTLKRAC